MKRRRGGVRATRGRSCNSGGGEGGARDAGTIDASGNKEDELEGRGGGLKEEQGENQKNRNPSFPFILTLTSSHFSSLPDSFLLFPAILSLPSLRTTGLLLSPSLLPFSSHSLPSSISLSVSTFPSPSLFPSLPLPLYLRLSLSLIHSYALSSCSLVYEMRFS